MPADANVVFVDIDTQRDFLDPDGALFIAGSTSIRPALARLTEIARRRRIPVVATACAHQPQDSVIEPFPPHCLVGSKGQERIPETARPRSLVIEPEQAFIVPDQTIDHVTIYKRHYDLFTNQSSNAIFAALGDQETTFYVYGVATDFCVKAAVEGLLARGRTVAVLVDAVRAVDSAAEPAILTEFVHKGAFLTIVDVIDQ